MANNDILSDATIAGRGSRISRGLELTFTVFGKALGVLLRRRGSFLFGISWRFYALGVRLYAWKQIVQ